VDPHIFREYDIRGLVEEDLDRETVTAIGRAFGTSIAEGGGRSVAVGMDVRESSPGFASAVTEGITRSGVDVIRLGGVPTPALYFAVHAHGLDGGVQITGSHNPIEYNGFKMMRGKASVAGAEIQELRRKIESGALGEGAATARDLDVRPEYLEAMVSRLSLDRPLKVVLDAGNGCAWELAPKLMKELGCHVECLYCEPDGTFPNHIPDPTLPETLGALRERVLATGADVGLAYDGDADRLGVLDGNGRVVWGDQLLALFAREVLATFPGAKILFEVKCSQALIEDITAHGGEPVMTKTGHSLIKKRMAELGAPLAGEMSGHMFFADQWFGFDDAIYASGRLVRLLAGSSLSLSELVDTLPRYHATPEIRIECRDEIKFDIVKSVLDHYRDTHEVVDIDGARVVFPKGWGLIRASNTQPVLVLRAEGRTEAQRDSILAELQAVLGELGVESAGE
jgi:phosphomannomutase/phosphoglucomutase